MELLKKQVEDLIRARYPGSVVELEEIPESEKLSGNVIWSGFANKSETERQQLLRAYLRT